MVFLYVLFGILGGILGGMGMGGGTILIPLLSLLGLSSAVAGGINLISFIPMAIISLIFHVKNKLVEKQGLFLMISGAVLACFLGFLARKLFPDAFLSKTFGAIMLFIGLKGLYEIFFVKK